MVESVVMTASDIHQTIDVVWRIESARLIAGLARIVRDVGLAEELAQDAFVAAPRAMAWNGRSAESARLADGDRETSRDRSFVRRNKRLERKREEIGRVLKAEQERPPSRISTRAWTTTWATTFCA